MTPMLAGEGNLQLESALSRHRTRRRQKSPARISTAFARCVLLLWERGAISRLAPHRQAYDQRRSAHNIPDGSRSGF